MSILQPSTDAADPWHNDVNQRIITLQILQSDFLIGDTILLKIGGNSNINGSKMHTSCSTGFIEVAVNNVNGNWVEQINTPKFEIVNQAAKSINIYLPSVIKVGEIYLSSAFVSPPNTILPPFNILLKRIKCRSLIIRG